MAGLLMEHADAGYGRLCEQVTRRIVMDAKRVEFEVPVLD